MIYLGGKCVSINGFANIPPNSWIGKYDNSLVISEDNWPKLNEIVDEIDLSEYGISEEYEYKVGYLIGRQSASTIIYTVANEVYLFSDGTSIVGTGNNNVTHEWTDSTADLGFPDRWVIVCSHDQWCKGYPILTYCYWATGGKAYKQNQAAVNVASRTGYRQSNTPFREMKFLKHIENLKLLVGTVGDYAFRLTDNLEDISNCTWDTAGTTILQQFFYGCSKLKHISTIGFDTAAVTNCATMFCGCSSLVAIDVSNWNMLNCTRCDSMFQSCTSLTSLNTSNWTLPACVNCASMFYNCPALTSIDISNFLLSSCTTCNSMFYNCNALVSIDASRWDLSKCINCNGMFYNCQALQTVGSSANWNLSNCILIYEMFKGCAALTNLDTSSWNLSAVTNCDSMFYNCYSLVSVDVSNWNFGNCNRCQTVFYGCSRLTSIGSTTNLDVSKCTTLQWFASNCPSLEQFDIASWNLSSCTNIGQLVENTGQLKTLCPNGWSQPLDMSTIVNYLSWMNGTGNLSSIPPFTNVKPGMNIQLNASPLSRDCVAQFNQTGDTVVGGIIYYLNDLTGQTVSTLRLSTTTKNYFTAAERAVIEAACTSKNWNLVW